MKNDIERIRQQYRPAKVRLLFVGESPPTSGRFFYKGGTALALHTHVAFERAFSRRFESEHAFLAYFRSSGCWLDDVCSSPVDHRPARERREALRRSLPEFGERLRSCSPEEIVVVLRRIHQGVRKVAEAAGFTGRVHALPFPGFGWQGLYRQELESLLREAWRRGVLPSG